MRDAEVLLLLFWLSTELEREIMLLVTGATGGGGGGGDGGGGGGFSDATAILIQFKSFDTLLSSPMASSRFLS